MLTQIHIRDLATIEELHLNLLDGSTMITGETGAGKSVFIEAIELALGARASQNIVRPGKEKAEISLSFDITEFPKVIACLKELDLYQDVSECIIRRIITCDGRSRCYVNGSPSTVNLVKELGELLFHLHGQHEQQVLLKTETQREMLDRFADHLPLAHEVKQLAEAWKSLEQKIHELRAQYAEGAKRTDYLAFQLEELQQIQLAPGEWQQLEAEHKKLTHADELIKHLQVATQQISDSEGQNLLENLNEMRKTLELILPFENKANEWMNVIQSVEIQLSELASDIKNYVEKTELDPEKMQLVEERVSLIFNLARKHKTTPEALTQLKAEIEAELASLNASDETLQKLEEQQQHIVKQYTDAALLLTQGRETAIKKLEKTVTNTIRSLSLPHGEFRIGLEKETHVFSPHGNERINFLIKTNPDQSLNGIAKVISGGELSRLSLALHLALANRTTIPTLIFDEVDTGLSGATAEKIGKLLRTLGQSYQVFCITHQAQVAANGHHHLLVEKVFINQSTHTQLRLLSTQEKTKEIARMLGGEKITQKTLAHAREILEMA